MDGALQGQQSWALWGHIESTPPMEPQQKNVALSRTRRGEQPGRDVDSSQETASLRRAGSGAPNAPP